MAINISSKRILLAEDDPGISEVVSLILKEENLDVYIPSNYKDLQNLLKNQTFSLILLDMSLWGEDGVEILKQIKLMPKYNDVSVILMSARVDAKNYAEKLGVIDIIEKPFEVSLLLQKVKQYLK